MTYLLAHSGMSLLGDVALQGMGLLQAPHLQPIPAPGLQGGLIVPLCNGSLWCQDNDQDLWQCRYWKHADQCVQIRQSVVLLASKVVRSLHFPLGHVTP